ncbi:unnamed protein product [Caenorhabditis angaria]|uniref:Uncharacterized protein n=1 Tax=Caenorhabditis angaria TaxID=860376 RepID=A0A9P1IAF6_9PELO|nr:unnamed protein product [Caenorhabditis angaria]
MIIGDETSKINCKCQEGLGNNGKVKSLDLEPGFALRVHRAEILTDIEGKKHLFISIGKYGCHIVYWNPFASDPENTAKVSSKTWTKNVDKDYEMLEKSIGILSYHIVEECFKGAKSLSGLECVSDFDGIQTRKRGEEFHSKIFYEIDPDHQPTVEFYAKCICMESKHIYIRKPTPQASMQCSYCKRDLNSDLMKTIHIKMKSSPSIHLYFVIQTEVIPTNVLICPSRACLIAKSSHLNANYYEVYIEHVALRSLD